MEFYSDEVRLYLDEILNNLKNLLYLLACYILVFFYKLHYKAGNIDLYS